MATSTLFTKRISEDNELYLYANGKLIYKRWMDLGYSKVFDWHAYGKDTFTSIMEDETEHAHKRRKIFINGYSCQSRADFWKSYAQQIPSDSAAYFGKNLDAFNDAITGAGPGFPGECLIEIVGTGRLIKLFGQDHFDFIIELLTDADFVDLILEKEDAV